MFQNYVYSDIIGVTETWLSDKILDDELLPSAYTIIRKDRGSHGGGVMFAIKSCKSFQVLPIPPSVEVLTVSVGLTIPTVYCLTYIPPNASADYRQDILDYLESLNIISCYLVLLGDFNITGTLYLVSPPSQNFVMSHLILLFFS